MVKKTLAAALVLAVTSSLGMAQTAADRQRGDRACRGDVMRLCRAALEQKDDRGSVDGPVLNCLITKARSLSPACRRILEENGQL